MKIREILGGRKILTVRPHDDIGTAEQLMAWANVRHLPVLDGGRVIGILTERDVLRYEAAAGKGAKTEPVDRAMTSPALTANPDDDLAEVEERMLAERLGCLPVIEKGRLVGLVTTVDLLNSHVQERGEVPVAPTRDAASVMVRDVADARPEDSLVGAILRMADRNVRHVPVVDGRRHVVGMLSDRDVRARVGHPGTLSGKDGVAADLVPLRVRDAMTTSVKTVRDDTPLGVVVDRLLDERIGALPVVDGGDRLVGMISYLDAMKVLREPA